MKTPLVLVLAFALGVAGVLAGQSLRGRAMHAGTGTVPLHRAPLTALEIGSPFPAVELVDLSGERRLSSELFGSEGGIVLFLELECPPCVDSARRWQGLVDEGRVDASRVAGITVQPPSAIAAFRAEHGIHFPILQDDARRFMTEYRVNQYPMKVVVDGTGVMQQIGGDVPADALSLTF